MFTGLPYGTRARARFRGRDGFAYEARVVLQSWTGLVEEYPLGSLSVHWGADGGAVAAADPMMPLGASTAEVVLLDQRRGSLAWTAGTADGAVGLRLWRDEDDDGDYERPAWFGYLLPELYTDVPSEPVSGVSLTFADGFGFLAARAFNEGMGNPDKLVDTVRRHLNALAGEYESDGSGAWAAMKTAVDIRPWVPGTTVTSAVDPLAALKSRPRAWEDDDGNAMDAREGLASIVGRVGARLFQSGGRIYVLERRALASGAGTAPTFTYAPTTAAGIPGTSTGPASTSYVLDLLPGTYDVARGLARELTLPVRTVRSTYDFRPDLENLVWNGHFSDAGAASDEAEHWTFSGAQGGGERALMKDHVSWAAALALYYDVEWVLAVWGAGPTQTRARATQADRTFLPATRAWALDLSFDVYWRDAEDHAGGDGGGVEVAVGAYGLHGVEFAVQEDADEGSEVTVWLEEDGLLAGVSGAVVGTPVIPKGAKLHFFEEVGGFNFYQATLTLTRDAKVGDLALRGDLDGDVEAGDTTTAYYWKAGAPAVLGGQSKNYYTVSQRFERRNVYATGTAIDGAAVGGWVSLALCGPRTVADNDTSTYAVFDDVVMRLNDSDVRTATYAAALPAGSPGVEAALPARTAAGHPVGDGPHVDSLSGLLVRAADGADHDTFQGASTGWKAGAYANSAEPSTERNLDLFLARETLRMLAGPVERWRGTILLREGQTVWPEHVLRAYQMASLAAPAVAGSTTVLMTAKPQGGQPLTLGPGLATEETKTVSASTPPVRQGAWWEVTLTTATTNAHYQTEAVRYGALVWWDEVTWDVVNGTVAYDGTRLELREATDFLEEITLGAD